MPNKSLNEMMKDNGYQSDESPTSEPQVGVASNGDINITYPDRFIRFNVTSITKQRRRYDAFVSVLFKPIPDRPARRLIADTHVDLSSTNSKAGVVRSLKNLRQEEWATMIEQVASAVQDNWQNGEAALRLADVPDPGEIDYLVRPLLQTDEHTVIFGPGGSGKSITVLGIGLTVATETIIVPKLVPQHQGPVLYLDWERSSRPHRFRFSQLATGAGVELTRDFHYKRMVGSLADSGEELKHYCGEHGIILCIADSVGMAVGGEISDEAAVMGYFNAARYVGGTWLSIAHVPKEESRGKPIGSQYWYTQPQGGTYEILGDTPEGSNILSLTMIHQKTNDERNPTLGWNVEFNNSSVRYHDADPMDTTTDMNKIPATVRIEAVLDKPMTAAEIATETGIPAAQVTNYLKRNSSRFVKYGSGRPQRWAKATRFEPELSDNKRLLSPDTGGEIVNTPPKGGGLNDNIPRTSHVPREEIETPVNDEVLPW